MTPEPSASTNGFKPHIESLKRVHELLDQTVTSLSQVGRQSFLGTLMRVFVCNTDALKSKANYSDAALFLKMAHTKMLSIPSEPLYRLSEDSQALWTRILNTPYPKFIDQLRLRYGAQTIQEKIDRVQQDLCDLIKLLE